MEQNNTSKIINYVNNEEQLSDKNETKLEMSSFENENVTAVKRFNKTPRKSTNKRSYSQISSIENSINKLQAISNSYKDNDDDEFDLFAKSVAVQLKKIPLDRAFVCQEKIMAVMKQERLYQLTVVNQRSQTYFELHSTYSDVPQSSPDLFSEQSTSSS